MSSSQLPTSGVAPAELEVDPGKENVVSTSFSNAAEAEVGVKRKSADDADEPGQSRARITDNEAVPPKTAAETTEERPASSLPKGSPEMVEGCSANNLPEDSTDCQVTDLSQVTKPKKKKRKSTEPLPRMVKTRNNFFGIKHRGQALGPNIGKHIKVEFVRPLMVTLRTNFKPTECVVDCYGLRYHLLIRQNKKVHDCLENRCLGKADADIYNNQAARAGSRKAARGKWGRGDHGGSVVHRTFEMAYDHP